MAAISYVSTKALNDANRITVQKLQRELVVATRELSSERLADVGVTLGARTTETVSFRVEVTRLEMTIGTNATVGGRLDVVQETLQSLSSTADAFLSTLIGARDSETGAAVAQNEARANLVSFTAALNSTFAGGHLFSGENVDEAPLEDYFGDPAAPNRQAVADAFQGFFGFSQDDPQVASIVPSQMQSFIDTTLAALFEEPAWSDVWSNASDIDIRSRISDLETIDTSTNANEDAFRKLAKAYTMVADLGTANLNRETFRVIANAAIAITGEATQDLAVEQARLGTSQERVADANAKMEAQMDVLTNQIGDLENVDPFAAAVRVTELSTQLNTAFAVTARVQQLTILNYL